MTIMPAAAIAAAAASRLRSPVRTTARPTPSDAQLTPPPAVAPPLTATELFAGGGVWPRAMRDGLLASSDYVDLSGYRAGKSAARLAFEDAWRQRLRDLPAATPDAGQAVTALLAWPDISLGRPA